MTLDEIVRAMGVLPDEAEITVSLRVRDLRDALTARANGPEIMSAEQAAQHFGYTPERWRRWAKAGRIEGAYQESRGGPWHLPRSGVESHIRRVQRSASTRPAVVMPLPLTEHRRGVPRGPWKKTPPASA